jgi:hypothetical protein
MVGHLTGGCRYPNKNHNIYSVLTAANNPRIELGQFLRFEGRRLMQKLVCRTAASWNRRN